jgi:hypothetical protein
MFKWLIRRQLTTFERAYNYDARYVRDILAADTTAFIEFSKVAGFAEYRKAVPRDVLYAAQITDMLAEDCGRCTQLNITMAERAGVASEVLQAIVKGDEHAMPDAITLAVRFTRAVLNHDPSADEYRAQIVRRWGARALVSFALAITGARFFPTIKYTLGHGQACRRVTVAGTPVTHFKQAA